MERVEKAPVGFARTAGLAMDAGGVRVRPLVLAPLLLRFSLAAVFFAHGAQKLFGLFGGAGLGATAGGFQAMGLKPAIGFAILAGVLEFFGSIALLVGLYTRAVSALLAIEMAFALVFVHAPYGFFLNWTGEANRGHGIEYNLVLLATLAALALLGAGRASIDASRRGKGRPGIFYKK